MSLGSPPQHINVDMCVAMGLGVLCGISMYTCVLPWALGVICVISRCVTMSSNVNVNVVVKSIICNHVSSVSYEVKH